jgi:hypothetical protein
MKKIYTFIFPIVFMLFAGFSVNAQNNFFSDISERSIQLDGKNRVIIPLKSRTLGLETQAIKSFLWSLPKEDQVRNNRNLAPVLTLPMPDGRTAKFRVWESSIQEPALEARFPEIRTFAGQGIDDPSASIRLDYTPRGFHAQVLTVNGSFYIDPYAVGMTDNYISYFRTDLSKPNNFTCTVEESTTPAVFRDGPSIEAACLGTDLRTYRLAVACTGEYAQAPGIAAGANPAILHAAIVTSVNRVVGVYEKEVSIRMILVANNNLVEFLNAGTDPFNGNNNANTLINESQTVIDANIGSANYDIGHTFSTGGGGLAQLNSPCGTSKARGITGSPSPTGDAYDIDYVAHEMGHQFGGNHSMAGCGSSPTNTKYEVGSGTTIQAYAGICGAQDIQPNSDPHFHAISFDEISNFVTTGNGATCAVLTPTGNTLPVIAPLNFNGVTIPISTPFTLTGTATDANGDALTYNWEQWDFSGTANWNAGATAAANNTVPLFKSRLPKLTGSRTFPDVAVINANYPANPAATMNGLKGETLSPVARAMKFKLTVRDNRANGGGVVSAGAGGCQTSTVYQINVAGTTPFTVTAPNGGESWEGNTSRTITWNVAATNAAPFNTANVKISLSTDGGLTYPTVISASTPNDGTETLTIPNTPTTTAKVKIEAIDNVFFDVSNANFTITAAVAGFSFGATTPATIACAGPTTATVNLTTSSVGGFVTPIVLTSSNVPAGATVTFAPSTVVPGSATVVTLNNTQSLAAGTYNVTVTGTAGSIVQNATVTFTVSPGTAPTIDAGPGAAVVCAGSNATFSVSTSGAAVTSYQWQVSTNGGTSFTNIAGANAASYTATAVTAGMNNNQYRVIVSGQCGAATSSAAILTVQTAPAITAQPQNAIDCVGNNATFTVTATGTGLTYQWQVSTDAGISYTNIASATNASYVFTNVQLVNNNNRFRVIVSGTCPSPVTSNAATLQVGTGATINTQPVSVIACVGNNASFTVGATGSSLTYQWQVSTDAGVTYTNITGATAATYSITGLVATENNNRYRVNVFSCTPTPITSAAATLTVNTLAAITTQPTAVVLCEGSTATYTVAAVGTGAAYQWQVSTTGCAGTFANIAGATTNTLTLANTTASQNGYAYRVVVTGTCNTVTSSCATLTVNTALVITTQPASTSACLPTQTSASFTVAASGTAPTYQWQVSTNGGTSFTNIAGATSTTLTVNNLTAAMTGYQYRAVLNGTCTANLNSAAATLTVNTLVAINSQPVNRSICAGQSTTFEVIATGSTITYQWQVSINGGAFVGLANAAPHSGVTTPTLAVTNATTNLNGYRYRVIVAGVPCGSVTSNIANLTVNALPNSVLVAAEYTNLTPSINSGLYTTVSPAGSYVYQWYRNNTLLSGVNGASYPVNIDRFGEYYSVATDVNGCSAISNRVTISDSVSNMVFVYPNPSSGQFQVRYYSPRNLSTGYTVSVFDSKGAKVWSKQYAITRTYEQMNVNLSNVQDGVFFLEVRDASGKRLASSQVLIVR